MRMVGGGTKANLCELFLVFLRLGLTSFGGPIAHLGYFRSEFVEHRRWLDEARYAQLLALCQFLPGPASSQMGFAIGLLRGGWAGALLAFVAFTLPSALVMFAVAGTVGHWTDGYAMSAVHGLKLVAVAVVAHALVGMARNLTPDPARVMIAVVAGVLVVVTGNPWVQLLAIGVGAVLGAFLCRGAVAPPGDSLSVPHGRVLSAALLTMFVMLLIAALLVPAQPAPTFAGVAAAFYRAGGLVFGGGHVVLPLLQQSVVATGWIAPDTFLSGYGAAQAMPGPMFSLAAFLGAQTPLHAPASLVASVALLSIFLPGFLLLGAAMPLWARVGAHPMALRCMAGTNAAVVGLLAAAFHDPVLKQGIGGAIDVAIAAIAFALLATRQRAAALVVLWCVGAAVLAHAASLQ